MRLYEHNQDGGWLMAAIRRQRAAEAARTGLHVSTICDDIYKTIDPKRFSAEIPETSRLLFQELGNAVEEIIAAELTRTYRDFEKPAPRQDSRGIWGSPDGWTPRSRTIHEIKLAWISETDFVTVDRSGRVVAESDKFFRFRLQAMKYGSPDMWDARRIKLHVVFVNGKYPRGAPFPNAREFTLVPTAEDYETVNNQLWTHAEDRQWLKPLKT